MILTRKFFVVLPALICMNLIAMTTVFADSASIRPLKVMNHTPSKIYFPYPQFFHSTVLVLDAYIPGTQQQYYELPGIRSNYSNKVPVVDYDGHWLCSYHLKGREFIVSQRSNPYHYVCRSGGGNIFSIDTH